MKKKVLIVEDNRVMLEAYEVYFSREETVELFLAATLGEADRLLVEHPDFAIMVFDGSIEPGNDTTLDLIARVRKTFKGPMIAASSDPDLRYKQVRAGCNYKANKEDVYSCVMRLLPDTDEQEGGDSAAS